MGATFIKRGKSYRITVAQIKQRATITMRSKGTPSSCAVRSGSASSPARTSSWPSRRRAGLSDQTSQVPYPTLRGAVEEWIDGQIRVGDLRQSTAKSYRSRLRVWAYPSLGDIPVDRVTREQIGAVIRNIREAW